jgi:hypothetical protein
MAVAGMAFAAFATAGNVTPCAAFTSAGVFFLFAVFAVFARLVIVCSSLRVALYGRSVPARIAPLAGKYGAQARRRRATYAAAASLAHAASAGVTG